MMRTPAVKICIGLLTLSLIACSPETAKEKKKDKLDIETANFVAKVIYGEDDRLDLYQVQSQCYLSLADATVGLISAGDLVQVGDVVNVKTVPLKETYKDPGKDTPLVCDGERFISQATGPWCTGFLIADNLVATAGHCIENELECSTTRFIFGFSLKKEDSNPATLSASEVYSCKRIVKRVYEKRGVDFNVIELDRKVTNHKPVRLRRSGEPAVGDAIVVIGHPSGLPTKVADDAKVRSISSNQYLVANLDTFGGNSGSPVFNATSGEVEGILVRGDTDYIKKNGCLMVNRCADNGCAGESFTKISQILPYVPDDVANPCSKGGSNEPAPEQSSYKVSPNMAIPDNSSTGVSSQIDTVSAPKGRKVKVEVNITHSWRGDLIVSLTSPDGKIIELVNRQGRSADDIVGIYGDTLSAKGDLTGLSAVTVAGKWTLKVSDGAARDTGKLNSWGLRFE